MEASNFKINSSVWQFAAGITIKIRRLQLAVPPSFTVAKGTQGFKEDPHGKVHY